MPRFHFNVYDGVSEIDREGTQLPSVLDARAEGLRLAGALLIEEAAKAAIKKDWRLEVTDGRGMILFRIDILLSVSPAVG